MTLAKPPRVSVIVPVYDDPRIARCVAALAEQTFPPERFEVIVVDNGGPALPPLPGVTLLREPIPGSFGARNRGIRAAQGEILAFTDADCLPDPGWLTAGVARLAAADAPDSVGGAVWLFPRDPARVSAGELYELVWGFPQRSFVEEKHFAATANLFVRSTAMEEIGGFDATLLSGGDVEWGERAHRAGKRMVFAKEALVCHPARRLGELVTKYRRTCVGRHRLRRINGQDHGPALVRLLKKPFVALRRGTGPDAPVERLRYAAVEFLLSAVQLAELARITCGGQPRRR
jgi:GT2 family glycosyltransferase